MCGGGGHALRPCCLRSAVGPTEAAIARQSAATAVSPLLLLKAQRCTLVCSFDVLLWLSQIHGTPIRLYM